MPITRISRPPETERPSSPYSFVQERTKPKRKKSQELPAVRVNNGGEHAPIPGERARRINDLSHILENETEPVERVLHREAIKLGAIQNLSLKKIVDNLCDMAFKKGYLLKDEFLALFKRNQIAVSMITNFISKYKPQATQISEEELALARKELLEFIGTYAEDNGSSLHNKLEDLEKGYPGINIFGLFQSTPHAVAMIAEQIDIAAGPIASDYYTNRIKEDPDNFLLDFIINRVTLTRAKDEGIKMDQEALVKLIELADSIDYPLEELHKLVFSEILRIRSTVGGVQDVTYSMRLLMLSCANLSEYPLLDRNLDFQALWDDHFQPAIVEVRRRKITGTVRLVDSMHTKREHIIVPKELRDPIVAIAEQIQDDGAYIEYLRTTYDYPESSNGHGESDIAFLSDQEVIDGMSEQLSETGNMLDKIIEKALMRRSPRDPIRRDCRVIPEIIGCRSVRDLITWLAHPEKFVEKYPQYGTKEKGVYTPYKIIAHFCRKMLELLDLYRKYELQEDRQRIKAETQQAEEYLCSPAILNIRKVKHSRSRVEFRIKAEVDPRNQKLVAEKTRNTTAEDQQGLHDAGEAILSPNYQASFGRNALPLEPDSELIVQDPVSKKWYLHYPTENKPFWETVITADGKELGMLIYGGRGELLHEKTTQSCIESDLREKDPENDKRRITFVSDSEEDRDALRRFLQEKHGARFYSVKDTKEGREHNKEKRKGKLQASKQFDKQRELVGVLELRIPVRTADNRVVHKVIKIEVQIQSLANMVITNCSDYTPLSHRRAYGPERNFEGILFKYIFPPALFGEEYAKYQAQGYRGDRRI